MPCEACLSIGFLNDTTHSLTLAFGFIAATYLMAATLLLVVSVQQATPKIVRHQEASQPPL